MESTSRLVLFDIQESNKHTLEALKAPIEICPESFSEGFATFLSEPVERATKLSLWPTVRKSPVRA